MFLDNQEKKDCCGCMACSQICPKSAIDMKKDERGFKYPDVNKEKCINCGLCEKVCPMKKNYVGQSAEPVIYAVHHRSEKVLQRSSSGGVFSIIADYILKNNGIVYGVGYDDGFVVKHQRATTKGEVNKFRTSKYVESDMTAIYDHIVFDLKCGYLVLVTGTPCQISAVTKYLELKHISQENLYTCDNICHGVPSSMVWMDYLKILREKYIEPNDEICFINMRSKKDSWKDKKFEIVLKHGNIDSIVKEFSFNRFYQSMYGTRKSCFSCRYTSYKRPSDITVGDFWNIDNAGILFDVSGGVSEVLINTEKGKKLFKEIEEKADAQTISKELAWQLHLEKSSRCPSKQEKFWDEYIYAEDKEMVIRKYMNGSFLTRLIRFTTPILQKTGLYGAAGKLYKIVIVRK